MILFDIYKTAQMKLAKHLKKQNIERIACFFEEGMII